MVIYSKMDSFHRDSYSISDPVIDCTVTVIIAFSEQLHSLSIVPAQLALSIVPAQVSSSSREEP